MCRLKLCILTLLLVVFAGAEAAPLNLSRLPPEINASLPPNILVTLDDSGSMGWGFMPDSANYAASNCRRYNSDFNRIYFNPNVTYDPPVRPDGTQYPQSNFRDAWIDGFSQGLGTRDLRDDYAASGDHQGREDYSQGWINSGFPSGVITGSGSNRRVRAFYCTGTEASSVELIQNQSSAVQRNFANWFSYYRIRSLAARSAISTAFSMLDDNVRVAWQNFNDSSHRLGASVQIKSLIRILGDGSEDAAWRTSFTNWLTRPKFSGSTPMRAAMNRAGSFFERTSSNESNPYWDVGYGTELACRQNFHIMMTDGYWNGSVSAPGIGNYDAEGQAIHGGRTLSGPAARVYYNVDSGGTAAPNLADLAMYYWARDLRPDLDNHVPSYVGDRSTGIVTGASPEDEIWFNPANDPADWQRMVNFMVTFGAGGTLPYTSNTLNELRTGTRSWPAATSNTGSTIDDAWHAAVNSRGEFLSADDPGELVTAMASIIDNVSRRQGLSGAAGSTAFLRTDAVQFEATYDSGSWGGDIIAQKINPDTGLPTGELVWPNSAGAQLMVRPHAGRKIFFNSNTPSGAVTSATLTPFLEVSDALDILDQHPVTGAVDGLREERINWIRGDRDQEQQNGGPLRDRNAVLGPFIGSSLINVAAPRFGYRGRHDFAEGGYDYAQFTDSNKDRSPTIYIGSNDGMLHAFDADTGSELWSYIPNRLLPNLARLTVPEFQFVPFVNATPIDHDVYINGQWRTVLIGTLGLGGQGVYALDVTVPETPSALWEVTDANDPLLGYTYGRANVGRLTPSGDGDQPGDGTWVAFVSAGYNAQMDRDYATEGLPGQRTDIHHAGSDSDGAVFVIRVADGAVKRIDIPNARGLGPVQLADYELDDQVDFIVAGDLNGDVWRVDLKGLTWANVTDATVTKIFHGDRLNGQPLHPITSMPTIFADPATGRQMVVVGTGKYLEDQDRETNIPRQRIYGLRECGSTGAGCGNIYYPIASADLVEQVITSAETRGGHAYMAMPETNVVPGDKGGWFLSLGHPTLLGGGLMGERVVDMPLPVSFPGGVVAVASKIPSQDPCAPLGTGAIYVLSAFTGGFALPGDMNQAGNAFLPGTPVFEEGMPAEVGILVDRPAILSAFLNPDGGDMSVMGIKIMGVPIRRRSGWREIPLE